MKKSIIILAALFCVVTGCGKQVEDAGKVVDTPTNKSIATNTFKIENTPSPVFTPTHSENDIVSQFNQLLPDGTYNTSIMKRSYIYPSSQDEIREKLLEKKFRRGVDLLINKEKDKEKKRYLLTFYNKETPFRSSIKPILNDFFTNASYINNETISFDEWQELIGLYNSAQEKVAKDKNTNLVVKSDKGKVKLTIGSKDVQLFQTLTIDFSKKKIFNGNNNLDLITLSKESDEYTQFLHSLDTVHLIIINDEELEPMITWYSQDKLDTSTYFTICQLEESKDLVLRYVLYDFSKNKFTEDIILIHK